MESAISTIMENYILKLQHRLKKVLNINVKDKIEYTHLHYAVQICKLLITNEIEIESKNYWGNTPLIRATSSFRGGSSILE